MSKKNRFTVLEDRGVLSVSGRDRVSFLQGLVSNDIEKAGPGSSCIENIILSRTMILSRFGTARNNGAAAGPQAMVMRAPG